MSVGIGSYSTNDALIDRTHYGTLNGAAAATVLGGGFVVTTMAMGAKGKAIIAKPTPQNLVLGGIIAGSAFSSVLASHLATGTPTERQLIATGAAALPAGVGVGLLSYSKTHNVVAGVLAGAGAALAGAGAGFLTSPFFINR